MSCRAEVEQNSPSPDRSMSHQGPLLEPEPEYDFVEEPDQDFYCPVSLEILTEPRQTSCCGHHISQRAAERIIRDRKPCPMCKTDGFTVHVDKYFRRKVFELKVRCTHKKNGCEWVGELLDLKNHANNCPKRQWKCEHCGFQATFEVVTNEHTPVCAQYPLPCPNNCEIVTVPRCDAERHLLVCPLQLVECQYVYIGCEQKIPRRDLPKHMKESAQDHLMMAALRNLRLTEQLQQRLEEKEREIADLKQQLDKHETKMTEQAKVVTEKLQQQSKDFGTKLEQQAKDLDAKLQQQTEDLNANHLQRTKDFTTQQTKELDTKLQQQTKQLDAKLQQQTKQLDAKLQQQTKELDAKLQQQTNNLDVKLQHQTKDLDAKTKDLDAKLQQQTRTLDVTIQQQTKAIDTRFQQQANAFDTKTQRQTEVIDAKLQQQVGVVRLEMRQQLKETSDQQTKDIDAKLRVMGASQVNAALTSLHNSISFLQQGYVKHEFILKGFKACQAAGDDGSWDSEQFLTHQRGYKLKLQIDTNGYGSAKDKYISAHLCLIPGSHDGELQWPLELRVILEMVNRRRNSGHHTVHEGVRFVEAPTKTLFRKLGGSFQFFPLGELEYNAAKNTEFLNNDCVKFNLYVKVVYQ